MKKCPNCGQPASWQDNPHRPFCSERCKLIDFGRWANEEYRVPAEPVLMNEEDEGGGMRDEEEQNSELTSQESE
jgi:endogenous inhibitor of DNA gyrase (YacG/DUF329 family)